MIPRTQDKISHILVVEDNIGDRILIERFFKENGFANTIDMAGSYKEALEFIANYEYDMAFIDVRLPDGLGLDLINSFDTSTTTVIMLSSSGSSKDVDKAMQRGAKAYIEKKLKYEDLQYIIRELETEFFGLVSRRVLQHA